MENWQYCDTFNVSVPHLEWTKEEEEFVIQIVLRRYENYCYVQKTLQYDDCCVSLKNKGRNCE